MKLTFDIEPVEQARPRATRMGRGIRLYDPKKVSVYKKQLAMMCKFQYKDQPLSGQLTVNLKFYRHVQSSVSKKERKLRLIGAHRPTVKPDVDNYIKSTLDGLNGLLWEDDNQIVKIVAEKYYSDHPRVEIEVQGVKENDNS
ncbi:RusA family crossover junction endodeoxyribonuclease [Lactobacillus reuteri]|uniref:RusA family crossover junction endodeoxyribonuclease n=1 Tax=Limosilactobacillus reuteri TaxID=1598 RepID=UPI001D395230|nr:RusA family crossover junction endodeoxyribonuclease [Limosilactobacillus reuteri]MQB58342.1 RusA family crossover junction endodeoxyribonuclease [Limosilactobacillus reuteri]MQB82493.1 RusA family crossover junction endodeoxyribonuclease [Limosilactobacillus reuteri]MQB84114.1 RusA family crossover junction endodeoxyribonuclease [Limosilactobacillus reuteri]MQB88481.1 RusA family crossover junction endodeoxyribonuclease [Limosilactobacillus reuteri]